jgi:hypothetical protein
MKSFFALAIALFTISAHAESFIGVPSSDSSILARMKKAQILRWEMDSKIQAKLGQIEGGAILLDFSAKEIELTLDRKFVCPAGQICTDMMPAPYIERLPLLNDQARVDNCGTRFYRAARGNVSFEVRDNRHNNCQTFIALPPVEMVYEDTAARGVFEADSFMSVTNF